MRFLEEMSMHVLVFISTWLLVNGAFMIIELLDWI